MNFLAVCNAACADYWCCVLYCRLTDKIAAKLLLTCRPYLIHCNLRGCNQIGVDTFSALRECRNLQDLNLSEVQSLNVSYNTESVIENLFL